MEYISHTDYTDMLKNFGKSSKQPLNESTLEKEGNAFTAALANTPKGGELKVGNKVIGKDRTNYDSNIEEDSTQDMTTNYAKYPNSMTEGDNTEKEMPTQTTQAPTNDAPQRMVYMKQSDQDILLTLIRDIAEKYNHPYAKLADIARNLGATPQLLGLIKAEFAPGPQDSETVKEGLNLPSEPLQATGPTIQTVEGLNLRNLSQDQRNELKAYVESIKTTKKAISELLAKAKGIKAEGGNTTNLVMQNPTQE